MSDSGQRRGRKAARGNVAAQSNDKERVSHLDKVQVLLVEEELHGLVRPLVDGGRCDGRDVVVVTEGRPVRSADGRLGYVEGVLGPRPRRRRRGVVEIEQAAGLLTAGRGGRGGSGDRRTTGGGARTRGVVHRLVEIGLQQADRALLASGVHRARFRHLDRRRVTEIRGGASARRRRCRRRRRRGSRRRTQSGDARRLRRQGWFAGHWRPPVAATTSRHPHQDSGRLGRNRSVIKENSLSRAR